MPASLQSLTPFYRGWDDFNRALVETIRPLSDDQLRLHIGSQLPVWTIAAHVLGARIYWFHIVIGEGDASLAELDGWDDGDFRPAADLVEGLQRSWNFVAECLARWTPEMLGDTVTRVRQHGPGAGTRQERTRQWITWHVLEHDLLHSGEIFLTLGTNGIAVPDL